MLRVASPSRGRAHHRHFPRNTLSLNGERVHAAGGSGALRRKRPRCGPCGSYDNNNGSHRIAKRTHWVVPTRRRRADLSDRGRGRRVVDRTIPWRGKGDGGGACLRHARRRVWGFVRRFTSGGGNDDYRFLLSKRRTSRCVTLSSCPPNSGFQPKKSRTKF